MATRGVSGAAIAKATASDGEAPEGRHGVGNTVSAMHALFSGAAFIGVLFTIFLQRKELKLQKAELTLMRTELRHTAKMQRTSDSLEKNGHSICL
jgi:hypothetical protein